MTAHSPLIVDASASSGAFTLTTQFEAHPGITVLFGPSGSGKSLTLATIAGLLRPTTGTIVLLDSVVADATAKLHVSTQDRRVGMVAQHGALFPHLTPLDNVSIAVRAGTRSQRRADARHLLQEVGAEGLERRSTTSLSGGEQQRIALARALAGDPQLLLLDEPFTALDQPTRVSLRKLVRRIVDDRNVPAVVVTHDLDDVAALADRIVLYQPGRTTTQHDATPNHPAELARILGLIHRA